MTSSLWPFLQSLVGMLSWVLLFFAPAAALLALVLRARREYREEAKEPFTDLPLRPPGESTRLAADQLFDGAMESLLIVIAACGLFGFAVATTPAGHRLVVAAFAAVILIGVTLVSGSRLLRRLREYWDYQLGFKGERVVAEELNQLLAAGFHVFHDVPFDGFNIDHVVVGAPGLFAVETKTRRKWTTKAVRHPAHKVYFDGRQLTWPSGFIDNFGLEQTERNARTLAKWLTSATGDRVECKGVLTLPGWWVERTSSEPPVVAVAATKGLHRLLPSLGIAPIPADHVRRIVHQLKERCRTTEATTEPSPR